MLDTAQVYSPPVVTVSVCVYCAFTGSSNTVSVPSVTVVESLVQVTVVAGPPVEITGEGVFIVFCEAYTIIEDNVSYRGALHYENNRENLYVCTFSRVI